MIRFDDLRCRFGCTDPVVAIVSVPAGCACWPDPLQALCWAHYDKVQSSGPVSVVAHRLPVIRRSTFPDTEDAVNAMWEAVSRP